MRLDAIFPKDVNYYGKIKKAVSLPDQAKIDREVPLVPLDCEMQIYGCLHRGCAITQGIGKEIVNKNKRGGDSCCFSETGNAVNDGERVACCGLVMAYNTDGAVVIVGRIFVVMRYCYESSKKEKQYQEYGNSTTADHSLPFR